MFLFSKAKVPVVPTVDCQAIYKSGLNIDINDFHICAGNGNMDSCSGDSGLLVSMLKQASLIKKTYRVNWGFDKRSPPIDFFQHTRYRAVFLKFFLTVEFFERCNFWERLHSTAMPV